MECGVHTSYYCQCKPNVQGPSCDQCKPGFFNLTQTNPDGCVLQGTDQPSFRPTTESGNGTAQPSLRPSVEPGNGTDQPSFMPATDPGDHGTTQPTFMPTLEPGHGTEQPPNTRDPPKSGTDLYREVLYKWSDVYNSGLEAIEVFREKNCPDQEETLP